MITHQIGFPPSLAFHNVVLSPRLVLFVCWIHDMATNIGQHRIHWWPHQLDNQLDRCLLGANTWRATINVPKIDFIANPTNASQCPKMSRSHSSRTSKSGFIKDTHNYTSCSGKNPYTLHLRSYSHGSTILFTDRLALGNLGPFTAAGLSASMMALFSKPIVSNLAVSILSMSYQGKLCALRLATACVADYCETHLTRQIHIFSEYKSAITTSASLDLHICNKNMIYDIQKDVAALNNKRITTSILKVAEHADLAQNELVDKAAKFVADRAANNVSSHISLCNLKGLTQRNTKRKGQ